MGSRFDKTMGIDVIPSRIEDARHRAIDAGLNAEFQTVEGNLPWEDGHFDVVTMIEVLEHVEDERGSLAEVRRVLSKSGRLYLSVPNRYFPFETHGLRIGDHMVQHKVPFVSWIPPLHRRICEARTYTYSSLTRLLQSCGFTVSRPEYIMPPYESSPTADRWLGPITSAPK